MVRKRYTPTQKAAIVLELLKEEETLPQIASRHGVHPNLLRKWKAQALDGLPKLFTDDAQDKRTLETEHQRQVNELYGEIGRLTTQLVLQRDFDITTAAKPRKSAAFMHAPGRS